MKRFSLPLLIARGTAATAVLLFPCAAAAQVALSIGAQEVYDDNVFLEDDSEITIPEPQPGQPAIVVSEANDGDPNDDFITHTFLGASGAIPVYEGVKIGLELKGGAMFFANEDNEGRFTADSVLKIESQPVLLPDPFFFEIVSDLNSGSNDVSVAEGTAARQSQAHTVTFSTGVHNWEFAPRTDLATAYRFARHDFLGEWTFSDRDSENKVLDQDGSDYFSNGLSTGVTHHLTKELDLNLSADVAYLSFTSVQTNDVVEKNSSDLDRIEYNFGSGFAYVMSDSLDFSGKVGIDLTKYTDDPQVITFEVTDENGNTQVFTEEPDDSQASFAFNFGANYHFDKSSGLSATANQSASTDIDGDRLITRTFALNASQKVGDSVQFGAGGSFTQFNGGDSLSGANDRFDVTASVKYALTEALALSVGWNYTNQSADPIAASPLVLSEDYEAHRFFVSVTAGLLGLAG